MPVERTRKRFKRSLGLEVAEFLPDKFAAELQGENVRVTKWSLPENKRAAAFARLVEAGFRG
ncbi:MAG: hypothetical protein M3P18_13510 [Actinomycetota bacterium]|nr:hypothetical protein [Actinomycetota bacterium]